MTTDCYGRSHPHGFESSYGADHFPAPDPLCGADHGRTYTVPIPPLPLQALLQAIQFLLSVRQWFSWLLSEAFSACLLAFPTPQISVLLSPATDSPHALQPSWMLAAGVWLRSAPPLERKLASAGHAQRSVPVPQFPLFVSVA